MVSKFLEDDSYLEFLSKDGLKQLCKDVRLHCRDFDIETLNRCLPPYVMVDGERYEFKFEKVNAWDGTQPMVKCFYSCDLKVAFSAKEITVFDAMFGLYQQMVQAKVIPIINILG